MIAQGYLSYSLYVFLAGLIGGLLPLFVKSMHENLLKLSISLGAGLLLGMAMVHMIPEAANLLTDEFAVWFLLGFVLLLVLERFIMVHACEETGCHYHTIGMAAFAGMAIHGIIEGMALGSSLSSHVMAPLILMAILIHKAPAIFTLTTLLMMAKKTKPVIVIFVVGISLAVPLGIFLSYLALQADDYSDLAGIMLSVSAGTFLYIAACDLLPEVHRDDSEKFKRLIAFMIGIAVCFFVD